MVLANIATIIFSSRLQTTPVDYATKAWYLSDYWKASPIELSLSMPWSGLILRCPYDYGRTLVFPYQDDMGKSIRATAQERTLPCSWA